MIVYKKAILDRKAIPLLMYISNPYVIVRMEVNRKLVIRPGGTRKLRALRAKVLSITDLNDRYSHYKRCWSRKYSNRAVDLEYVVGKYAVANGLEKDPGENCGKGIHFFRTRKEAVEY